VRRPACALLLLLPPLLLLLAAPSPARASTPAIDVYTMGPGDDLFSAFGHAAICVRDGAAPAGRCYNYGTADFNTPLPLTWDFLRGRARFWVSLADAPAMLRYYTLTGRAVWRQTLPVGDGEAARIAAALAASAEERVKYYRYHHFDDNCTTRIRDVLDRAGDGRLGRQRIPSGRTYRQWARGGFAGHWPLLAVVELVLGRAADRATDSWAAMFLPDELRRQVARGYGAEPQLVVTGAPRPPPGATWLGSAAFVIAGVALALLLLVAPRVGRALTAAVLGLVAVVLWSLAALSSFPELTRNEMLLALWPTDLLLPFLGAAWLRRYLWVRLGVIALMLLGHAAGLLVQPLAPLLLPLLPLAALAIRTAWRRG
jgi:hypothetical protein